MICINHNCKDLGYGEQNQPFAGYHGVAIASLDHEEDLAICRRKPEHMMGSCQVLISRQSPEQRASNCEGVDR